MTHKEQSEILARFKEGKNAAQVSQELRIPLSAVERLARKSGPSSGGAFAGGVHKKDGGLDKALSAAGFAPSEGGTPTASPESKPPTISPEALVALVVGLNGAVCRAVSTIYRLDFTSAEVQKVASITKSEKDMLEGLAPYATDLVPEMMQYAKPALAWGFVGLVALTVGTRGYELREMSPRVKEAREQKARAKRLKSPEAPKDEI